MFIKIRSLGVDLKYCQIVGSSLNYDKNLMQFIIILKNLADFI